MRINRGISAPAGWDPPILRILIYLGGLVAGGCKFAGAGQFYFDLPVPGCSIGGCRQLGQVATWLSEQAVVKQRQLGGWLAMNLLQMKTNAQIFTYIFSSYFFCNKTENKCQELSLQWIVISVFCDFCLYFISVLWFFLWFFSFSVFLFLFSDFHFFFAFWFLIFFVFRF